MTEQKFTTKLQQWLRAHDFHSCVIEAKVTPGKSIAYDAVRSHQYRNLTNVQKQQTMTYKVPDDGYAQKPWDVICFRGFPAYIAVLFESNNRPKDFFLIPIRAWRMAEKSDIRKSLTKERAARIGMRCMLIT